MLKAPGQVIFQGGDLLGELGDDLDQGSGDLPVGDRDHQWGGELGAGQRLLDLAGAAGEVALPAGGPAAWSGRPAARGPVGGRRCRQDGQGVGASQVGAERGQRAGVVLPQGVAELVDLPLPVQTRPWWARARILTASTVVAVAGDGAVVMPVGYDQVGQDAGIAASLLALEVVCRSR